MPGMLRYATVGLGAVLALLLAGCGDDVYYGERRAGMVGIVDHPTDSVTAPLLTIDYTLPRSSQIYRAEILSDQRSDGDIVFDPPSGSYTITQGPEVLIFGRGSARSRAPEYRAFLDFPLDGSAGGPVVPLEARIVSATLRISVDFVDFAHRVPVLLDLVRYAPEDLTPADFDSYPLAVLSFDIFDFNEGRDVLIDVSLMMQEAQRRALAEFQVRFMLGG